MSGNSFGSRAALKTGGGSFEIHRLDALEKRGLPVASRRRPRGSR